MFGKKFKKYSGEINSLGVHRNMTRVIINITFVYHFVDLDLRFDIFFEKE